MSTTEILSALLTAQGRTVRPAQADAAAAIDAAGTHAALQCPTGVGKSALAIAASVAYGSGVIAVHSNGLIAQYAAEIPEWEEGLGIRIETLVGKGHYWCPKASPSLAGLTDAQKGHVASTGSFIGSGLEQRRYEAHTVLSLAPVADDEEEGATKSPCDDCQHKAAGTCPLWSARYAAAEADVVITNATMLGVAIGTGAKWADGVLNGPRGRRVIVLDEAHADAEPIAQVLGSQLTIRDERAAAGLTEALNVVFEWAGDDEHRFVSKARKFLAKMKLAKAEGRKVQFDLADDKVTLTVPADLSAAFADRKVIAMSATLSQRNVEALGLATTVQSFQGLDVSASTVFVHDDAPTWAWGKANPVQHAAWAEHVAGLLADSFRKGGALLGLFVSKDDLNAVVAKLPADVKRAALHYYSGVDRTKTIETYKANPSKHLIVGCVSGAGTGVNLPGDLLRTVVVTRVPQNAPKGADRAKWAEDTRAAVVQSVGRAHRFDGDWGHVHVVGGFGGRADVKSNLTELGWVLK